MNFDIQAKSNKKKIGGRGRGGGLGTETKTVCQTVSNEEIQKCNYLHNVEHVVQSNHFKIR